MPTPHRRLIRTDAPQPPGEVRDDEEEGEGDEEQTRDVQEDSRDEEKPRALGQSISCDEEPDA